MNQIFKINFSSILFFIISSLTLIACSKTEEIHTIKYKIRILNQSKYGSSVTPIYVGCSPYYEDSIPRIPDNGFHEWEYNYIGPIKFDQRICFNVQIPLSVYYEMWIYVDDLEYIYRKIKTLDYKYYSTYIEEARGVEIETGLTYLGGDVCFSIYE
jgi:hypothetical protein